MLMFDLTLDSILLRHDSIYGILYIFPCIIKLKSKIQICGVNLTCACSRLRWSRWCSCCWCWCCRWSSEAARITKCTSYSWFRKLWHRWCSWEPLECRRFAWRCRKWPVIACNWCSWTAAVTDSECNVGNTDITHETCVNTTDTCYLCIMNETRTVYTYMS